MQRLGDRTLWEAVIKQYAGGNVVISSLATSTTANNQHCQQCGIAFVDFTCQELSNFVQSYCVMSTKWCRDVKFSSHMFIFIPQSTIVWSPNWLVNLHLRLAQTKPKRPSSQEALVTHRLRPRHAAGEQRTECHLSQGRFLLSNKSH